MNNQLQPGEVQELLCYFAMDNMATQFSQLNFVAGMRVWSEGLRHGTGMGVAGMPNTAGMMPRQKYYQVLQEYKISL